MTDNDPKTKDTDIKVQKDQILHTQKGPFNSPYMCPA